MPHRIQNKEELDTLLAQNEPLECFILLKWGLRSSKSITSNGESYWVFNEIDDTEDLIEQSQFDSSNIGKAINNGVLYTYNMDTVYISKTGKTYSYKQTATYNIAINLDEALEKGYTQNKAKWAQMP